MRSRFLALTAIAAGLVAPGCSLPTGVLGNPVDAARGDAADAFVPPRDGAADASEGGRDGGSDGGGCHAGDACETGHACQTGTISCDTGIAVCVPAARPAGTVCRASAGTCDVQETCDGTSADCPVDDRLPSGTICRAATGACDAPETCDGAAVSCPSDALEAAGVICRAAASDCDAAETCTGASAACPTDAFVDTGTSCEAASGVTGFCDGLGVCLDTCTPGDACRVPGHACARGALHCAPSGNTCEATGALGAGTTCRASAGACDPAETCDGTSMDCPSDALAAVGTTCRARGGACDVAELCDGASAVCPSDALSPGGTSCRPSVGDCDVTETCTGASADCPSDALAPSSTVCRPSSGDCDLAESCTGSAAACPTDAFAPSSTVCRPSSGDCDLAESCTGSAAACPTDAFEPSSTVCRASTSACDAAESCTGAAASCPPDAPLPTDTCGNLVDDDCNGTIDDGCAFRSCAEALGAGRATSGVYALDPDGAGGAAAFSALCDMTTDGGGWTRIGRGLWYLAEDDTLTLSDSVMSQARVDALRAVSSDLFRTGSTSTHLYIRDVGAVVQSGVGRHFWRSQGSATVSCATSYASVVGGAMTDATSRMMTCDPIGVGQHTCASSNGWILWHAGDTYNVSGNHPCPLGSPTVDLWLR